jgi:hypothetical protein
MTEQHDDDRLKAIIERVKTNQTYPNPEGLKLEALDIIADKFIVALTRNASSADRLSKVLIALEVVAVVIAIVALVMQFAR